MEKFLSLEKFYTHVVGGVGDYYQVCIYPMCEVILGDTFLCGQDGGKKEHKRCHNCDQFEETFCPGKKNMI